jgi:catechol 2,3-dioxygenase-like lactoylglutathione lyase family enzyme
MELRVCIDVDDLEKGIDFYCKALGLSLARRLDLHWAELAGATAPIDLLAKAPDSQATDSSSTPRKYQRHWTPVHIDLVVDDMEFAVARAVSAGAILERGVEKHAWGFLAILADPFGHGFCLLQFIGRGYGEIARERAGTPS